MQRMKTWFVFIFILVILVDRCLLQVADFRYLNLRIGIAYLLQTAFEDAGDALFRGELDPRWLMCLWEEWAAIVSNSSSSTSSVMVDVYSGLQPALEELKNTTIKKIGL